MLTEAGEFLKRPYIKRLYFYCGKAFLIIALLFLFSQLIPSLPSFALALLWAVLSGVSAIGLMYHVVIRKSHNEFKYKEGGLLSKLNTGRFISFIITFVVSAILVASLILEVPKWGLAEWLTIIAAVPLFYTVYLLIGKFFAKEYEPLFCTSKVVLSSSLIVGILLCVIRIIIFSFEPVDLYIIPADAYLSVQQPFAESPSALMVEAGKIIALIDGLTKYGLSIAAETSYWGYRIGYIALCASTLFGFSNLIGICSLELSELRRVFLPLASGKSTDISHSPVVGHVVTAAVLPFLLVAGFLAADFKASRIVETEEYTVIESFIRDKVGVAVYLLDGKYYDQKAAQELIDEAAEKSKILFEEAQETLVPLINESFDKRIENVDGYLDWYYSLPADYERLAQFFTGTVESGMETRFVEQIDEGIDNLELESQIEDYLKQAESLEKELIERLSEYELVNYPEWLLYTEKLSTNFLAECLEPTQKLLDSGERIGISIGAGIITGFVAKKITEKVLVKQFFSKLATKLTTTLAAKGIIKTTTSTVGGVVGTSILPGAGTGAGVAVGAAVAVLIDFLMLEADEALNRESYKQEIIDSIEISREEMLSLVQGTYQTPGT